MKRLTTALLIAYGIIAIITFGHCAAYGQRWNEQHCLLPWDKQPSGCDAIPVIDGAFAAVLWPLYWSWEAWS